MPKRNNKSNLSTPKEKQAAEIENGKNASTKIIPFENANHEEVTAIKMEEKLKTQSENLNIGDPNILVGNCSNCFYHSKLLNLFKKELKVLKGSLNEKEKMYLLNELRHLSQNIGDLIDYFKTKSTLIEQLDTAVFNNVAHENMAKLEDDSVVNKNKLIVNLKIWIRKLTEYHKLVKTLDNTELDNEDLKKAILTFNTYLIKFTEFKITINAVFESSLKTQLTKFDQTISEQRNRIEDMNNITKLLDPFYEQLERDSKYFPTLIVSTLWSYVSSKTEVPTVKKLEKIISYSKNVGLKVTSLQKQIQRNETKIELLENAKHYFENELVKNKKILLEAQKALEKQQQINDTLEKVSASDRASFEERLAEKQSVILSQNEELNKISKEIESNQTKLAALENGLTVYKKFVHKTIEEKKIIKKASTDFSDVIHTGNDSLTNQLEDISSKIMTQCQQYSIKELTNAVTTAHIQNSLQQIESIERRAHSYETNINNFNDTSDSSEYLHITEMLVRCLLDLDKINSKSRDQIILDRRRVITYVTGLQELLKKKVKQ